MSPRTGWPLFIVCMLWLFVRHTLATHRRTAGTINAATGTRFTTGGVIRVLRQYPRRYDAWAMAADGSSQLLATLDKEPTYQVCAPQMVPPWSALTA